MIYTQCTQDAVVLIPDGISFSKRVGDQHAH